jgi:hypothetical protein
LNPISPKYSPQHQILKQFSQAFGAMAVSLLLKQLKAVHICTVTVSVHKQLFLFCPKWIASLCGGEVGGFRQQYYPKQHYAVTSAVTRNFFFRAGGSLTNSVEDRG